MSRSSQLNTQVFSAGIYSVILVTVSLVAIVAVFTLASSNSEYGTKSRGFSAIIFGYLLICLVLHIWNSRNSKDSGQPGRRLGDAVVDEQLFAIEEASEYFGGSLTSADMFRLVANKVDQILPFTASVLYVVDRTAGKMRIVQAQGENAERFRDVETDLESGLAGRCNLSGLVQIDRGILASKDSVPAEALAGFRSSAAVPLLRSGEVFAIIQFYSDSRTAFDGNSISLFEAVAERVTPLIMSSLSFERSLTNALTDPITELPNERAFQLILENQIAETQRNRDMRPLTIIAIDIRGFDEFNNKYGHATGDRILSLTAHAIKGQLRQMDFFARASNDEFLAILPTANQEVADDVIGRITTGLFASQFFVGENQTITPELYFGTASFGKDGETADPLILSARLRKQQSKANAPHNVVMFPENFVN
jgi:diguanylate cyclase (GGDEF)-like protein